MAAAAASWLLAALLVAAPWMAGGLLFDQVEMRLGFAYDLVAGAGSVEQCAVECDRSPVCSRWVLLDYGARRECHVANTTRVHLGATVCRAERVPRGAWRFAAGSRHRGVSVDWTLDDQLPSVLRRSGRLGALELPRALPDDEKGQGALLTSRTTTVSETAPGTTTVITTTTNWSWGEREREREKEKERRR
jgi:hypothetical protein